MKRFSVLFSIFLILTTGAFGQLPAQSREGTGFIWSLVTDFNTGLFNVSFPTGERTEKTLNFGGAVRPNDILNNPLDSPDGTRGNFTYTTGHMDILSYGSGQWIRGNQLRVIIGYQGNHFRFHTRTLLDNLVRADRNDGTGIPNEIGPNHSFVQTPNGVRTVNWADFLSYSFDEYYLKASAGFLSGFVGNTPNRGKVNSFYTAFTEDTLRTIMVEHYGVITPDANADFLNDGQDTNNFMRAPRVFAHRRPNLTATDEDRLFGFIDIPYFMLGVDFSKIPFIGLPLTFQVAADPGNNSGIDSGRGLDSRTDLDFRKINGAFRLSGENIFNLFTFDAIYRVRGGDPDTRNHFVEGIFEEGIIQPDGLGIHAHSFGLYTNILGIPNLGLGLGYSGYIKTFEDNYNVGPDVITISGPLMSGFDLRVQFTGINNLTITSANNVSFARVARSSREESIIVGVLGQPLRTGTAQRWFALYNAIGFDYRLGDRVTASLQIANRFGKITTTHSEYSQPDVVTTRSRMQLGGGSFIAYQFSPNVLFQGGFIFRYLKDSYTNNRAGAQDNANTRDASGGLFSFAFPVRIQVVFGNNNRER